MKITVPTYEIPQSNPFASNQGLFNHLDYANSLLNLVEQTDEPLVLAIDAPWGEGKSTFVKSWSVLLNENGISSIYFDAFESDYVQDPFSAIAGEVYSLLVKENPAEAKNFSQIAVKAAKIVSRASIRIATKVALGTALDDTVFDDSNTIKDTSKEASDLIDKAIESTIQGREDEKRDLESFRTFLKDTVENTSGGKPIVIIIDELDRCKPSFALSLLESVKHLFSVQGLVFVLVTNRNQLHESIRAAYGHGIDAPRYLQKFVTLWAQLPESKSGKDSDKQKYVQYCLDKMEFDGDDKKLTAIKHVFRELEAPFGLSLREIERSLTNFAIVYNSKAGRLSQHYVLMTMFLSVLKISRPDIYKNVANDTISYEQLFTDTGLDSSTNIQAFGPAGSYLTIAIRFFMETEEGRIALVEETGQTLFASNLYDPMDMTDICKWLDLYSPY